MPAIVNDDELNRKLLVVFLHEDAAIPVDRGDRPFVGPLLVHDNRSLDAAQGEVGTDKDLLLGCLSRLDSYHQRHHKAYNPQPRHRFHCPSHIIALLWTPFMVSTRFFTKS
jgi:hypothetical protein